MVITVLQHGLGNQLFQYAAGRAVAERLQTRLLLDATRFTYLTDRTPDLGQLRICARWLPDGIAKLLMADGGTNAVKTFIKKWVARTVYNLDDAATGYDARVARLQGFCRLDGFWQCERYFAHLRPKLLEELEPSQPLRGPVEAFAHRVAAEDSVAVHIRRGDLVTDPGYAETVGTLGADYYHEALARIKDRMPHARVYLFSDDPAWCEKNFPDILPVELVSGRLTQSAVEDLTAMKRCRHFVIANSTFSWWGAWLGEHPSKQVIAPERFFRLPRAWEKDLLPTTWETVEPFFEPVGHEMLLRSP